jgi:altronate dehydratase
MVRPALALPAGAAVADDVAAGEPIPSGHKVAVAPIAAGEAVRRYGQVIGAATQPIPAGAHVHVHNLVMSQLRAEPELRNRHPVETPEIYGAEHLLYARARSPEISAKLRARIDWGENYTKINGGEMNNNPSPGNKAGGLSTILEKSLGAVAKAGTSPLNDVIEYAHPVTERGLVFMDSPGFDPCSFTGQVASGANIVAFTTGRGSAFGCTPATLAR